MRRSTALIALGLAFCMVGLIFADMDVPLTNGTFDTGLDGWSRSPAGVMWDSEAHAAFLYAYGEVSEDTESYLSQEFLLPENAYKLSFDLKMTIECEEKPETDIFSVTVNGDQIYRLTCNDVVTAVLNDDPHLIENDTIEDEVVLATYQIYVSKDVSTWSGQNVELKFNLLNDNDDSCITSVLIDNVYVGGMMDELWPPNHKYHSFELSDFVSITDKNGYPVNVNEYGCITTIYSDEPEEVTGNGDGNTVDDIVIEAENDYGFYGFQVRAERQGTSNGRVYGVTFQVVDPDQDEIITKGTFYLGVPHDQSGGKPVDDGPSAGYVINNN